ncbi:DUF3757 domain-containing protein [Pseudomonas sp. SWRI107]|uniref:DUF3757 domain-containing protein n=1 Tax=Pseudomonas TaxID=286 RepID=UPI00164589AC|nr:MULTISPECIES: DUF3757 domain-containing protein [Pseudomonas]MBC3411818.1 DUF3757 domain-containing protein [Pseudomonas sp. SWRI51]MBV4530905.1 DUF3757 domain-containing protein [Pseudomonas farsensis]
MLKFTLFPAVALLLVAGQAVAQSCPEASTVTQKPEGTGFAYMAAGGWTGENPMADEHDLKTFKFTAVKIKEGAVLCDYEADERGGARMQLKASKQPAKGNWSNNFCKSANPADCTFK